MEELEATCANVKNKYAGLLEYFGEDPSLKSEVFFSTLNAFLQEFTSTRSLYEKNRTDSEKKKAKEASDLSKRNTVNLTPLLRKEVSDSSKRNTVNLTPVSRLSNFLVSHRLIISKGIRSKSPMKMMGLKKMMPPTPLNNPAESNDKFRNSWRM